MWKKSFTGDELLREDIIAGDDAKKGKVKSASHGGESGDVASSAAKDRKVREATRRGEGGSEVDPTISAKRNPLT